MFKIQLKPPKIIFGQGQRQNNEDYYYPNPNTMQRQMPFFLVCDGMGGAEKGEIASKMAVEGFAHFFENNLVEIPTPEYLSKALARVEKQFDTYITATPIAKGMGTTLTLLWFHQQGITIGHIGDSRIYRFRTGEVKPLTEDHSFVGELLAANLITEKEAEQHPKKNVITRAIQGGYTGGTKMTVQNLKKVNTGDIYMLCSDGITEACPTPVLHQLFESNPKLEDLHQAIKNRCIEHSHDNYTALLIEVEAVETASPIAANKELDKDGASAAVAPTSAGKPGTAKKRSGMWRAVFVVTLITALAVWGMVKLLNKEKETTPAVIENTRNEAKQSLAQPYQPQPISPGTGTKEQNALADASSLKPFQNDQNSFFGYQSDTGIVIPAKFSEAWAFSEGIAKVKDAEKGLYGFINPSGAYLLAPVFLKASSFKNGVATVQQSQDQKPYQIDVQGRKLVQKQKNLQ
ncbi:protein phosphatase 2C domain-containing protein [Phaeodactylibacter xiamenensis]|uniref:protein phosphatase 2C domain-containing protein n=1 Tax=Phaeodactylibacter xiamenensis TaxID=1524460 RepID=UPI0024A7D5F5|nr:protein phosphatase 2C domain-containing protein [Phaeodactylibacter xiamenensis]